MKSVTPWLFLVPVLLLLAELPSHLRGALPYHISTVSYVLSIFGWLFTFCAIFALSRGSRLCHLFFALIGIVALVDAGYRLWVGPRNLVYLVFDLIVIWVAIALIRIFPLKASRRSSRPIHLTPIGQLIEQLRTRSDVVVVDQAQSWLVIITKGEGLICEITVPHDVLEWFASVKHRHDRTKVWSDSMDYCCYDDTPIEKLEVEMARDVKAFIDRVSNAEQLLPLKIYKTVA